MEKNKLLEIREVSTSYGKVKMLQGISLEIYEGEIVCLLGSNGSGKSTTIRTIIGLVKPDTGEIYFDGVRIEKLNTYHIIRKGIAIVPEGRRLFPKMTVLENLKIGGRIIKDAALLSNKLEEIFQMFPRLLERSNQNAATLSGGEQAMVSIGRALMSNPKLLILDEPSFGLAPILVEQFYETIEKVRLQGTTILLSEQNAGKALAVANRGYVLQKGEIILEGNTIDLRETEDIKKAYLGE